MYSYVILSYIRDLLLCVRSQSIFRSDGARRNIRRACMCTVQYIIVSQ